MLGRRGARAERGMPRGWTALCLLSLLREYRLRARPAGLGWAARRVAAPLEGERAVSYTQGRDPCLNLRPHAYGCSRLWWDEGCVN